MMKGQAILERAFLGSEGTISEAEMLLRMMDGRENPLECCNALRALSVALGHRFEEWLLGRYRDAAVSFRHNVAYAAAAEELLSDHLIAELHALSSDAPRVQHIIIAGFGQRCVRRKGDASLLKELMATSSRYDTERDQRRFDDLKARIAAEISKQQ